VARRTLISGINGGEEDEVTFLTLSLSPKNLRSKFICDETLRRRQDNYAAVADAICEAVPNPICFGQSAALLGVIGRSSVIGRQIPALAVLLGRHFIRSHQMPFQHLQALPSSRQTSNWGYRFLRRHRRFRTAFIRPALPIDLIP